MEHAYPWSFIGAMQKKNERKKMLLREFCQKQLHAQKIQEIVFW